MGVLTLFILLCSCSENRIQADILIENGIVYDGVDTVSTLSSVAIKDDKIVFVGDPREVAIEAAMKIDASGLIVAPGFIDPHTHADRELNDSITSHNKPFLFQGITTVVTGNDGASFYPTDAFAHRYESFGIGTNAVPLVGHGTIRELVMGKGNRKASPQEIKRMQVRIAQEMEAGAFGMSTGLFYAPGSYSNTEEVIALASTVAGYDGIYDTHLRDESSYNIGLIAAIHEVVEIGREANLPVHISHIKCLGVDVWKQSDSIVEIIEKAQEHGIEITANQYPYEASATGLKAATIPRWAESGGIDSLFIRYQDPNQRKSILEDVNRNIVRRGGADKLLIVKADEPAFVGMDLLEISESLGLSPEETVFKILETGYVRVASFNMDPYDINRFMKQDWVVTGSDGNTGHPRKYGSFPRKFNKYVQEDNLLGIGQFINRSSSKTAQIFKIPNRGKLLVGYFADIIVFDPKEFKDKATYKDAFQLSEGLEYSIVNGTLAISQGKFTGQLSGKVLKK